MGGTRPTFKKSKLSTNDFCLHTRKVREMLAIARLPFLEPPAVKPCNCTLKFGALHHCRENLTGNLMCLLIRNLLETRRLLWTNRTKNLPEC